VNFIKHYYHKGDIFKLFLVCAFPIHVWSIFMFLRDFDWISERTNAWDAVGVGSYALLLALIESLIIFLIIFGLSFLVHKTWDIETRLAIMTVLVFFASMWAALTQAFFLLGGVLPESVFNFLVESGHPFRYLYGTIGGLVIITIGGPVILLLQSEKLVKGTIALIERIILLSGLYLFLDLVGIVIVIIRNVS
jgi:hypothetical protein